MAALWMEYGRDASFLSVHYDSGASSFYLVVNLDAIIYARANLTSL
jgi:hypothetical protein